MNQVFLVIILLSVGTAAFTGTMEEVSMAAMASAKGAVELAIGLIGYMALFLGLLQVAHVGGLLKLLARAIQPLMVRLFPDVPEDHPAMGAMIMNIAANMLGLGNAATPLGIKAMQELDKLNPHKGTATNAMALFLAINTSGVALLPSGVVSVRAQEGSMDPWGIVAPSLIATGLSTVVAIIAARLYCRLPFFAGPPGGADEETGPMAQPETTEVMAPVSQRAVRLLGLFLTGGIGLLVVPPVWAAFLPSDDPRAESLRQFADTAGDWVIPALMVSMLLFGHLRGVKVYEQFVEGAKEGFETAVRIIPYMVAILVAVGMFRASGAMALLTGTVGAWTGPMGLPGDAIPMALVRPLSGSGAFAVMSEILHTHGPDSYIGYVVSVLNGSTETTFYVMAIYFGAVGVSRARHAVAAGLTADLTGVIATVLVCRVLFGHLMV